MIRRILHLALLAAASAIFGGTASAQPFTITVQQALTTTSVSPGGSLPIMATAIGQTTSVRLTISYHGGTEAAITGLDRNGSNDFSLAPVQIPQVLMSAQSLTATLTYTPSSGAAEQAVLNVTYVEANAMGQPGPTNQFTVTFNGTVPDLVFSYTLPNGNATPVPDGGMVPFPSTQVNTTKTVTFSILNRGSGQGTVSSVTVNGTVFMLSGLQIPPFNIAPGSTLQFSVNFSPLDRTAQTGSLTISVAGGKTSTISLSGTGTSAVYTYAVVRGNGNVAVAPGQALTFPDTNVGDKSLLTLQVQNTGNGPGIITAITSSGASFSVSDTPFLPLTVNQNDTFTITLTFAPTTPGALTGRLKVGDDTFDLAGNGIGALLTYSFSIAGAKTTVSPGGVMQFPPTKVGGSVASQFVLANTGNVASITNTIFLTGSSFSLSSVPVLPLSLDPGTSATFTITFTPGDTTVSQGTLQIGTANFSISGSGAAPDAVPTFRFGGPSGQIQPLQQPSFTLTLDQAYANDLTGTLSLAFTSTVFTNDPTVQFASGGRTVGFSIPSGTRQAVFPNFGTQIAIQTGSVAGTITISPRFFTSTGVDITPASTPVINLNVPQGPPQITNLAVATAATGFTLQVTGYATSRSVQQLQLTFTPNSGQTITNTNVTVPVDTAFQSWFNSSSSGAYGSVFSATIPFTLTGNASAGSNLVQAIQSVSVVLSNAQGNSAAQSINIQ